MLRRGLVVNTLVALIAILVTGGMAAQAVIRDSGSGADSDLIAAGVDGRDAFAIDSPAATAATRATASTQPEPTTTAAPQSTVTTIVRVPAPPEAMVPPGPVTPNPPPPPPIPENWPVAPPPPPSVIQTGPASWSYEAEGVTITARASPVAPRVGDTVTISYTTGGAGEFCCRAIVFVGSRIIGHTLYTGEDPCPPSPLTSGTASDVVTEPGPFTFQVHATRAPEGCLGAHIFTNISLNTTLQVLPA